MKSTSEKKKQTDIVLIALSLLFFIIFVISAKTGYSMENAYLVITGSICSVIWGLYFYSGIHNILWQTYSNLETRAKFPAAIFMTIAVFSYKLHWIIALIFLMISITSYIIVKRKLRKYLS